MQDPQAASSAVAAVHPVLDIRGLTLEAPQSGTVLVRDVDLSIAPGSIHGLVGETGAGKSLTAWSVLGLLPRGVRRSAGAIVLDGTDLTRLEEPAWRRVRGRKVSIVVQNPRTALLPSMTVGSQLALVYRARTGASRRRSWEAAVEALADVRIGNPAQRARDYPHQLSGGQAQRVVIAMALLSGPKLVIADEATTGLDVTVQSEVLDLLVDRIAATQTALLLITHDIGVVANYTQSISAMFAGEVIESADTAVLFDQPAHPYMAGLLDAADPDRDRGERARVGIAGPPPNLSARPLGCQFGYRCPRRDADCASPVSPRSLAPRHQVRCVRVGALDMRKAG